MRSSTTQTSRSLPGPTKTRPVKVITISIHSIEPQGYEVVGTNIGGQEIYRLKVKTLSSLLLPDLYNAIEENTDGDPKLVAIDGGLLPGRHQALTLADALATATVVVNGGGVA